ncbi:MAG: hypothetical protein JNK82_02310 [Myxococcaceae bacterium]|nr:hypothetical protein [Myxococcaceae bacterium]
MFIGHFAVGFATKPLAPKASLGWLMLAPMFCDVLWPLFLALGIETTDIVPGYTAFTPLKLYDQAWSHSVVMVLVYALALAGVYFALNRDRRGALVVAGGVVSHWVLDVLTHRPELQLYPGGEHVLGLELWASVPGTVAVEGLLFAGSTLVYARTTEPLTRFGTVGFVSMVGLLVLVYAATVLGPPPPSWQLMMYLAFSSWGLLLWAHLFDRRRARVKSEATSEI